MILFLIETWEVLPEKFRHFIAGSLWFVLGWQVGAIEAMILCAGMGFIAETRDEVENITKPACHPEGFNLTDLFYRILSALIYMVAWFTFSRIIY